MSTGAKWALGIAGTVATVYGCVVGHRMLTKPSIEKVAKNFSEIFRRDVSKEEAKILTEKYKEIFKVENCDDFCKNIFEQVKKDFGYENVDIKLKIVKMPAQDLKTFMSKHSLGSYSDRTGELTLYPMHSSRGSMCSSDKLRMFKTLVHEFQHARQSEYAYRTNPAKYLEACQAKLDAQAKTCATDVIVSLEDTLKSKYDLTQYMKENVFKTIEEAKKNIEEFIKILKEKETDLNTLSSIKIHKKEQLDFWNKQFGKFSKFKEGSKEYELGMKYIDGNANYVGPSSKTQEKYLSQFVEVDARANEPFAEGIFDYFANPWRVF